MAKSPLGMLAERRAQIAAAQSIVCAVPEWEDPRVFVRFRPLAHTELKAAQVRIEKAKDKAAAEVDANAGLLIKACLEVWGDYGDGEKTPLRPDPESGLTKFDGALALALGLEETALASQVVKTLFMKDGDILATAQYLGEQSGYRELEGDEGLAGE